jgi:phosphohistidine phosphatase
MPFELYLMRHGIAEDFDPSAMRSDSERKLTREGKDKLNEQAKGFPALELDIGLVLSSPYTRARQTADIIMGSFSKKLSLEITDDLVPEADPQAVLEYLAARDVTVPTLCFGHEPHISTLASYVLSGDSTLAIEMKKGSLVGLQLPRLRPPFRGLLTMLVPPRALRAIR